MAFPQDVLGIRVDLLLNNTWTNLTSPNYVLRRDSLIQISRGRADEAATVSPSRCSLSLNNRDGRFTSRNPVGPYYGAIGRNTQMRVSVPYGSTYLRVDGSFGACASTPDATALGITGDIDIRIEASLDSWRSNFNLAGQYSGGTDQEAWALQLASDGTLWLLWSTDGTGLTEHGAQSTAPVPQPGDKRQALRVTLDVNNGSGGYTATFYYSNSITGTWTQLGAPVTRSGVTSIFNSTYDLTVGDTPGLTIAIDSTDSTAVIGKVHRFELRNGISGTVVANPDFTIQTAGATSFADSAGRTWSIVNAAELSDRRYRFYGEVSEWPQRWDTSGTDIWTPIEASGILRRLQQGASPLHSTMYRALTASTATPPLAYWPCEDAAGATRFASALTGGRPMTWKGTPSLASDSSFLCSEPLPTVGSSIWTGTLPAYTPTGQTQTRFLLSIPTGGLANNSVIARLYTTGSAARYDLVYTTTGAGSLEMKAYDSSGTLINGTGQMGGFNGRHLRVSMEMTQDGTAVDYQFITVAVGAPSGGGLAQTAAGNTVGQLSRVVISPDATIPTATVGHISVHDLITSILDLTEELAAWVGEAAGRRVQRLCREEGVTFRWRGSLDDSIAMGPQSVATFMSLVQECVDADGGLLYEPRDAFGIAYRPRSSMYSQDACVTLDYAQNQLFGELAPTDDDQLLRNDRTVSRTNGSSARYEQEEGRLSVLPPPDGVGRYSDSLTVNVQSDDQLPDIAAWGVHLGTVDEQRYPQITVDLSNPASPRTPRCPRTCRKQTSATGRSSRTRRRGCRPARSSSSPRASTRPSATRSTRSPRTAPRRRRGMWPVPTTA
jgi:hypothetical protein